MKVAFIHDWFIVNGGAEKVVKAILETLDDEVDIYCLFDFFEEEDRIKILKGNTPKTSFLQHFPKSKKHYRNYLPFFPKAIESFDLSKYDLIISSSSSVAKSVKTIEGQIHVCYCHSPMRYIWDLKDDYIKEISPLIKRKIAKKVFNHLQSWDKRTAKNVTHFIANSNFIEHRIKKNYNRDSIVLHPPINTAFFIPTDQKKENYFVVVSRLVGYKKIDLIVNAFSKMPNQNLIVIGDGPDLNILQKKPNINYLGYLNDNNMRAYVQKSRATIAVAIEDFGIAALEAQSCGIPVIALKKGGYLETVIENKTGVFFENQTAKDIVNAISKFEKVENDFSKEEIRKHALNFTEEAFKTKFKSEINSVIKNNYRNLILKKNDT